MQAWQKATADYCWVYCVIYFTSPAGWLPVHWDQLQTQCSVTSMGKLYLLPFSPGLPGWASTRRNIHPLTPNLIIKHPLSTSSTTIHSSILTCLTVLFHLFPLLSHTDSGRYKWFWSRTDPVLVKAVLMSHCLLFSTTVIIKHSSH